MPGLLIAGTHSGVGKTTTTAVILSALRRRGLDVQPFKVGPDFIDAAYHTEVAGRQSINLDMWMMGEAGVRESYRRWSSDADVSVVEAMGALYDGEDGTGRGSPAELAKLLDLSVIVVLDVSGMTRTAAALLQGLRAFDPTTRIAGCVLNRIGSAAHAEMTMDALSADLRDLVLGTIPRRAELTIPERHLGLLALGENPTTRIERDETWRCAAEDIDVDRLVRIAGGTRTKRRSAVRNGTPPTARLAIARDRAFSFYYEENLLWLREVGFDILPFRPTLDAHLPAGVDAVYIGGGYPESFAAELEANVSLAAELRERVAGGMPVHAECGGLMYLGRTLTGFDGVRHRMTGVLPLDIVMDPSHLAIRYIEVRTRAASPLGPPGTIARGQEFHQSRITDSAIEPTLFDVMTSSDERYVDGYAFGGVTASYAHLHLASNPVIAANLARSARARRAESF